MELVSSVSQASDLVRKVAVLLNSGGRILHYLRAVLALTQADIVLHVRCEFCLRDILILKVVRLLLEHSQHHSICVGVRVQHAHLVSLGSGFVLRIAIHEHLVRMATCSFRVDCKSFSPALARRCTAELYFLFTHVDLVAENIYYYKK